MRNLKRVLSLTLASVMLLGMMVVGSSAADYADVTSEHNTEAIEVLQAVGIMVGDNGNFNPDKNVTRNEMAVVMSNLMNYRVATYAGSSPFTDVPAWAADYVAACYTNGITSGVGPTTYGGDKSVTTGQAALMLMKALGYFQYPSDFKSDWLLETTRLGSYIDLFNGVEAGVRAPMTRNDVAQLVLNTLEASTVEADDNAINVSAPDGTTVAIGNTKYFYRVDHTGNSDYVAIGDGNKTAQGINGINGPTIELGEKLYAGDLKKIDTRDAYGRPGVRWTYELSEVGHYADKPIATYNAKVSAGELYTLVGKEVLDDIQRGGRGGAGDSYRFVVYADGARVADSYNVNFDTDLRPYYFVSNSSGAAGEGNKANQSGAGVLTEVYRDGNGNVDIVYINTYLMQATADYNSNKGTLNVDVIISPDEVVAGGASITTTQLHSDDFDIADYKEDDYILYTVGGANGKEIQEIFPAKVVKGEVTAYSKTNSVTIDGTKYNYAKRIEGVKNTALTPARNDAEDSAATEYRVGDVASIVVDQYDNVLYVDSAAISLGNYLYVNDAVKSSGIGSNVTMQVYLTDGTKSEVTLGDYYKWDNTAKKYEKEPAPDLPTVSGIHDGKDSHKLDGWYSYSVGSDGKYSIREAKSDSSVSTGKLEGEKANFAGNLVGNADTVLIVDDGDDVKVYTGVRNFPTITGSITVTSIKEKDDTNKTYVAAAFVDASGKGISVEDGTQDNILYVLNQDSTYVDKADNVTVYVYNAILDGQETTIKAKAELDEYTFSARWSVDGDGFYKVIGDSNKNTYCAYDLKGTSSDGTVSVSGASMEIKGYDSKKDHATKTATYIVTDDTEIVVVLVPDASATGSDSKKADQLKDDLMDNRAADYEVKTVNGKRLNSMLGSCLIAGKVDMFLTEGDGNVVETLYITVYGIADKPAT